MSLILLILLSVVITVVVGGPLVWIFYCWVESDWYWPWDRSHVLNERVDESDWLWEEFDRWQKRNH